MFYNYFFVPFIQGFVNAYAFIVIIYYLLYVQNYLLCSLSFLISAESSHSVLKIHLEHW